MANSDKNIIITPNINESSLPSISFIGAGNSAVNINPLDDNLGTLSFRNSGSEQFFSLNNDITGLGKETSNIFRVNDRNGQPVLNANTHFTTTVDLCPGEGQVKVHGHNYIVSACYSMSSGSRNTIVNNNDGYIQFEIPNEPSYFCTDQSVVETVNSGNYGLRFWKAGIVHFYMSQDIIGSGGNYMQVLFYINGQQGQSGNPVRGAHLVSPTGGQWDGFVVYQSFRVREGDTLEVRMGSSGTDITNIDVSSWSYYSLLFHALPH